MRKYLFSLVLAAIGTNAFAQSAAEVAKSINAIKRDTMYIYAEATMSHPDSAYFGAKAILEMKVGDWVRQQHPDEGIELCIVKAKEHFMLLQTRRGDFYRAFVYVRKNDIMPVSDPNEVSVFEIEPKQTPQQPHLEPAIIVEEEPAQTETPVPTLTAEEERMKEIRSFYNIEPYINDLKRQGKLRDYGKYATMPEDGNCYLFVYNQQGNITALLRKTDEGQLNLNTLKQDNIKNYKNCGAIWFRLKQ